MRGIPYFPKFRVLEVMQDFYHQPYHKGKHSALAIAGCFGVINKGPVLKDLAWSLAQ